MRRAPSPSRPRNTPKTDHVARNTHHPTALLTNIIRCPISFKTYFVLVSTFPPQSKFDTPLPFANVNYAPPPPPALPLIRPWFKSLGPFSSFRGRANLLFRSFNQSISFQFPRRAVLLFLRSPIGRNDLVGASVSII